MATEEAGLNRRTHRRTRVVVPVEIRVLEGMADKGPSQPMHAVLADASLGGVCVQFLGPVAQLFAQGHWVHTRVELRLLWPEFANMTPVLATIRWSRAADSGWHIGVQLVESPALNTSRLLRRLIALTDSPSPRRSLAMALGVGAVMATAILVSWAAIRERTAATERLTVATAQVQQLNAQNVVLTRRAEYSESEVQRLQAAPPQCPTGEQQPQIVEQVQGNDGLVELR